MRSSSLVLAVLAVLLAPLVASAQSNPVTGYVVQYYNAGAPQPVTQSDTLPVSAVTCGVTPKIAGTALNTVNPTTALWDDPAAPTTADCRVSFAASASLFALPLGAYESTVVAVSAGGNSIASNRAPFLLAPLPPARTGLRLTR